MRDSEFTGEKYTAIRPQANISTRQPVYNRLFAKTKSKCAMPVGTGMISYKPIQSSFNRLVYELRYDMSTDVIRGGFRNLYSLIKLSANNLVALLRHQSLGPRGKSVVVAGIK